MRSWSGQAELGQFRKLSFESHLSETLVHVLVRRKFSEFTMMDDCQVILVFRVLTAIEKFRPQMFLSTIHKYIIHTCPELANKMFI